MKRILITGAGGTPSTNFIRSLRKAPEDFYIVGTDCDKYYLIRAEVNKKYLVPKASDKYLLPFINKIIVDEKIDFIHIQNDAEVIFFSENREKIKTKTFLPKKETVKICQDKYLSYKVWEKSGIKVQQTMLINNPSDLKIAFNKFKRKIWLRAITGAGGRGSLPVTNLQTAKHWINFHQGWGTFTASELLSPHTTTWMSVWHNGELIVAQGRKRLYWELGKISPSGVSSVTGAGVTVSDPLLDDTACKAILAIDNKPHGLFGVDLVYGDNDIPYVTEINIARFFTTHHFYTSAGVNMPYIFTKLAFSEKIPKIQKKINPCKPGLVWIRGVDFMPVLVTERDIEKPVRLFNQMKKKLV